MNKKLATLILTAALLIAAWVQIGGTIGARDMSGDTHARAAEMAE